MGCISAIKGNKDLTLLVVKHYMEYQGMDGKESTAKYVGKMCCGDVH
jgi:hypothetical protein